MSCAGDRFESGRPSVGLCFRKEHHDRTGIHAISLAGERRSGLPGYDIFGSSTRRIDPLAPLPSCAEWWQLEIERLPVGVNYQVHVLPFLSKFSIKREAVRIIAPVRVSELYAVPRLPRPLDQLIESSSRSLMLHVPQ